MPEPTPSDLQRGQSADLILDNGLNLERWADRFYNSFPKVERLTLSEGVLPINIAEDSYQGKPNPHISYFFWAIRQSCFKSSVHSATNR